MTERSEVEREPRPILTTALAFSSFLAPLGIDGFIPAMVALAAAFESDVGRIQFALGAFFLGGAIGQAVIGPLADRFGRRPTLLIGTALYSLSALLAVWAGDVAILIALRFIQGASASSGRIVSRAVIRDLYSRKNDAKVLAYMSVIGTSIPIFSPMITAQLVQHFGWQAMFIFMAGASAALFALLWYYVEETLADKNAHAIRPAVIVLNFIEIVKNRDFQIYGSLAVMPAMGLSAFLTGSSAVLIGGLGLDPTTFSYAFALMMVANTIASFTNARLVVRFGFTAMLLAGVSLAALGGLSELALAVAGVQSVSAVIGPMMIYMTGMALVMAPAQAGALVPFPDRAGAASSFIGIVQGLLTTMVSIIIGLLPRGSATSMAAITAFAGIAMVGIYALGARRIRASDLDK